MTGEILELMSGGVDEYRELGWSRLIGSSIKGSETAGYNSVLSSRADIGKDCYLEVSWKRDELRSKELMDAFTNRERSFEDVMRFLSVKEGTDNE